MKIFIPHECTHCCFFGESAKTESNCETDSRHTLYSSVYEIEEESFQLMLFWTSTNKITINNTPSSANCYLESIKDRILCENFGGRIWANGEVMEHHFTEVYCERKWLRTVSCNTSIRQIQKISVAKNHTLCLWTYLLFNDVMFIVQLSGCHIRHRQEGLDMVFTVFAVPSVTIQLSMASN